MTANELADWIDEVNKPIVGSKTMKEASAMLRQQADRIAELEGEVSNLKHINKNWQLSETMAYNRIAELEKRIEELTWDWAIK